jgi:hypothetical protein
MLDFNSVLVFSEDPKKLADFYKKVFQKDPDWSESGYYGFLVGKGFITFGPHDKVRARNAHPERILLNFETKDVKNQEARGRGNREALQSGGRSERDDRYLRRSGQ